MAETLKIDGKMNVHIICPTHVVLDDVADKILLPTVDGDVMVLWNRAPFFASTRSGIMWVYNEEEPPQAYYISNGVVETRRNICSVLAWGIKASEIDKNQAHARRIDFETKLQEVQSDVQKQILKDRIEFLKMLETRPSHLTPPIF